MNEFVVSCLWHQERTDCSFIVQPAGVLSHRSTAVFNTDNTEMPSVRYDN